MMQYTRLAKAVSLTLPLILLAGCDENVEEVTLQSQTLQFDPANGVIPYPNDIVGFDGDGTLSVPGETDWANTEGDSPNTYWNYYGTQKGWGTSVPLVLSFTKAPDEMGGSPTIDGATLQNAVKMFKEVDGILEPLEWNSDFRAILAKAATVNIEPLKPLDEASRYFVALTNDVKDAHGQALQTSSAFKQLLTSNDEMGLHLQGVVDSLVGAGISESSLLYAADFTTGSNISILRPVVDKYLSEYSSDTNIVLERAAVPPANLETIVSENTLMKQLTENLESQGVQVPEPAIDEGDYVTYTGTINLPAYMDEPTSENCTANPYVEGMEPSDMNAYRVAPQKFCPGAYSYWQTDEGGLPSGIPLNPENAENIHVFKEPDDNKLGIVVHVPKSDPPAGGYPVVMTSHGYGGSKEDTALTANQLVSDGYVVIGIDHPMHGERSADIDGDGANDLSAGLRKTDYASPENLLTTTGFMWQLSLDYMGVRMAVTNGIKLEDGQEIPVNNHLVHLSGGSLGGIHSTMISTLIRDAQERHKSDTALVEALDIRTTTLNVPGGGVASILMQSAALQPEFKEDILDAASFRLFMAEQLGFYNPRTQLSFEEKVEALNQVDEYRNSLATAAINQPDQVTDSGVRKMAQNILEASRSMGFSTEEAPADFAEFEEQVWKAYETPAEIAYQAITDPNDPVNYAKVLAEYKDEPVLLNEAVGDGSNSLSLLAILLAVTGEGKEWNPGDFVIPNQPEEMPLAGTDPLIRTLELDILTGGEVGDGTSPLRVAGRYGYGTHMSSFIPIPLALFDADLLPNDLSVHNSMVDGMIDFLNSNGTSMSVKNKGTTNGDDLLLTEDDFPEHPEY
ncbi:hypothetical protein [Endozoicomonas arenosclerae]|uniref:hypothetical protein n=1 Tax=Endozoicomonas arenosclerae TaxID=1633495 RepID=UPI0007825704|nr:hypothetical protein [Endozoicomonas arenosclerae]